MSFDLTITRGDERTLNVTVTNPNGTAANLTGKRLTFAAKRHIMQPAVITKTSPSGGIAITDAINGLAAITIASADTASFPDTTVLVCDLQMDNNPGQPITVASGTLRVLPDVAQ